LGYGEYKAPKGVIKAEVELSGDRISRVLISGDFFMYPEEAIEQLERVLVGVEADREKLLAVVRNFYDWSGVRTPAVRPEHWAEAILRAARSKSRGGQLL